MANTGKIAVRVRMYRQGLGDCFLLTFQRKNKADFNLLIDCGLYQTARDKAKIMTDVASDIKKDANANLDVVVLTHDHYDHTSGFSLAKDVFDTIAFKQVWVGWTEDKNHPKYEELKNHFSVQAEGLRAALRLEQMQTEKLKPLRTTIHALVNDFFGVSETTLGAIKDDSRTWEYILKEKDAEVKTCNPGQIMSFEGLEDEIRVYVLGPPHDISLLLTEDAPAAQAEAESYRHLLGMALSESFLAAVGSDERGDKLNSKSFAPFDEDHQITVSDAAGGANKDFFRKHYFGREEEKEEIKENSWRQIESDWLMLAGELALRLDNGTNNTCLAIAIELVKSGKVLVFPGDAQFGNWYSWKDLSWKIKNKKGDEIEITIKDLLERTVLYKVGHHGSHNATLKTHGLKMMTSPELVAMIPTNREFAKEKQGWEMPDKELEKDLIKYTRGRIISADEVGKDDRKKHLRERCENLGENKLTRTKIESFLEQVNFAGSFSNGNDEPLYVEFTIKG